MGTGNRSGGYKRRLKDKKITLYAMGTQETYRPIHEGQLWAYVRHLSGEEYYAAATTQSKETMMFVINWRNDIAATGVIEYKGQWYDITRIDTFEGYKDDIALYGKSRRKPSSLGPYISQ